MALTDRERSVLDFERSWWQRAGPKTVAIRERLNLSPTQYYRMLAGLVSSRDADAYDPLLVRRLRRVQANRRKARLEGRPAALPPGR
jgi:hypothetical protein